MSGERRARSRELRVRDALRAEHWIAYRLPQPSNADVLALRAGDRPRLVQVKSTAGGPYEHFGPADRRALLAEGEQAGADVVLAWWPKGRPLRWIWPSSWPPS